MTALATGAVYDRGYRPYEGVRGGRRAARFALFRASVRRALGLRRSWRQKVAPFVLLGVVTIPAIVNVGIAYVTREQTFRQIQIITYREYVGVSSALLLFVALTAPDIVCPDRRQRVLPLLFARPLTGTDYVVSKVGAQFFILFAFSVLPQAVLFLGQALVSDSTLEYTLDNLDILWKVPLAVGVLAIFYASIGVAIASLTSRRIVAGASIIGFFLVTSVTAGVLVGEDTGHDGSPAALINVLGLPLYLRDFIFDGEPARHSPIQGVENIGIYTYLVYLAILAASLGLLLHRYRWTER